MCVRGSRKLLARVHQHHGWNRGLRVVFIPNEQIYAFINMHDRETYDYATKHKVILCSPWSLYPILAVIRLAIDNFVLESAHVGDVSAD